MISEAQLPELAAFLTVEETTPLTQSSDYSGLVRSGGNDSHPVHRWMKFKEAFSADLLKRVIVTLRPCLGTEFQLLDPFCGVGTALVAAQELSADGFSVLATGIEQNPFIGFAARTKVQWPRIDPIRMLDAGERVLRASNPNRPRLPNVASIRNGVCITRHTSRRLLAVKNEIVHHRLGVNGDALLLGLASAIEPLSKTRKDGRALRIVRKRRAGIAKTLRDRWLAIAADVRFLRETLADAPIPNVIEGDGRNPLAHGIRPQSIDLIVTSPPYPNTIDYTEVYKLELWMLGFVSHPTEFLRLRRSTFRSHPTTHPPDLPADFFAAVKRGKLKTLLSPLLQKTANSAEKWRHRLLLGYFSDMWVALSQHYVCLRPGGYEVLVVGNSLHGGRSEPYLIPTDLIVAALAQRIGFEVVSVKVARALLRRLAGNHFLRESVVLLRRPTKNRS